jgi:hypothetical protein
MCVRSVGLVEVSGLSVDSSPSVTGLLSRLRQRLSIRHGFVIHAGQAGARHSVRWVRKIAEANSGVPEQRLSNPFRQR